VRGGLDAGDVVSDALHWLSDGGDSAACDVGAVLVVALPVALGLVADSLGRLTDWLCGCVSNDLTALAASFRRQLIELPTVQVLCLISSINTTRGSIHLN
jgi:hypothetical protein